MAWLAAFAILLQALTPVMHHPAGMALAGTLSFDEAQHLCIALGSTALDDSDTSPNHKSPIPKLGDCAICQAVHAIGGFVPPVASTLDTVLQNRSTSSSQPRAPPIRA